MKGEYWISSGRISRICPGLSSANILLGPGARTSRCLPPLARGPSLGLMSLLYYLAPRTVLRFYARSFCTVVLTDSRIISMFAPLGPQPLPRTFT